MQKIIEEMNLMARPLGVIFENPFYWLGLAVAFEYNGINGLSLSKFEHDLCETIGKQQGWYQQACLTRLVRITEDMGLYEIEND